VHCFANLEPRVDQAAAARTEEHRALFQEDIEAAYFSSTEELINKVKFFLESETRRNAIDMNGFRKAHKVPYTYEAQLDHILNAVSFESRSNA
jgi:spore maturation protein CgeB